MVVLGSGGHTSEMLMMIDKADLGAYDKIFFVIAQSDVKSHEVLDQFIQRQSKIIRDFEVLTIPRTNEVGDGKLKSIIKTLFSIVCCFYKLLTIDPVNILICNGPGICVSVIISLRLINVW